MYFDLWVANRSVVCTNFGNVLGQLQRFFPYSHFLVTPLKRSGILTFSVSILIMYFDTLILVASDWKTIATTKKPLPGQRDSLELSLNCNQRAQLWILDSISLPLLRFSSSTKPEHPLFYYLASPNANLPFWCRNLFCQRNSVALCFLSVELWHQAKSLAPSARTRSGDF